MCTVHTMPIKQGLHQCKSRGIIACDTRLTSRQLPTNYQQTGAPVRLIQHAIRKHKQSERDFLPAHTALHEHTSALRARVDSVVVLKTPRKYARARFRVNV